MHRPLRRRLAAASGKRKADRRQRREGITGWLVQRDEQAFADRLDALLGDEPRRRQMGESGMAYVRENWTWQTAVDRLETQLKVVQA